jgi:Flp pilus assembly protein TadG
MTCRHALKHSQRGQSLVEMALILPIFLVCVLGMIDLGRAVYAHTILSNAVRDGCRTAIVSTKTSSEVILAVRESAAGVNIPAGNVTISGSRTPGSTVTVSAFVVFSPITPLVRAITGSAITLRASSAMVVD